MDEPQVVSPRTHRAGGREAKRAARAARAGVSSSVRQCGRSSRPNASARPIPFHPLKAFDVASTTAAYRVLDRFGFS